ncbi:MAG: S8 family serine peptidase, partial [Prosthecobacter sp.]
MSRSSLTTPFRQYGQSLHGRLFTWAVACLLACLTTTASAQMRERYVTQDAGSQRAFIVALDEFNTEGSDRKPRKQSVAAAASAETMRAAAERHARRTGEAAEVVLYEEGLPRTPFTRRILTKGIAVKLLADVDPAALALKLDLVSRGPLSAAPGWFIFETKKTGGAFDAADALRAEPGVETAEPQLARLRAKRFVPNDALFSSQWHLGDTNSVNVKTVWDTWRGSGIRIGIIDDGIQTTHPDLLTNVDTVNDHNWLDGTPNDANPNVTEDFHGTSCAGLAAAQQHNSIGVSGVAPEAMLVGLRLITNVSTTDTQEAEAMGWKNDIIQVKSNSWGPIDDGLRLEGPGTLTQAALANAAQTGRGGLGTIFVWSGGNGRAAGDHSNYDGYANSIYTIAVAGSGLNGQQIFESEYGANLMVTAPSQGSATDGIVTTDLTGTNGYNEDDPGPNEPTDRNYTNSFGGTSASCPMVAGCVALMLQSKPTLGWRDVQEILMRSATKNHPLDSRWVNNSVGWHFNDRYGAGLVNVQAAVTLAASWTNLQPQQSSTSAQTGLSVPIPDNNSTGITRTFDLSAASLRVERVTVTVNINHAKRGELAMTLTSPGGMQSSLAEQHGDMAANYANWTFSTVRSWGENAAGNWTLKITDNAGGTVGTLTSATLKVYGTPRTYTVTTSADAGTGSLRQALADAAASPGPDTITFAAELSGQTIHLTTNTSTGPTNDRSSLIINGDTSGVTMDATALPGGLTLSDNGGTTYRLLKITGSTVTLRGLTFKDGGITTFGNSSGGAIATSGSSVTIERCTFTGNIGDGGGAIYNENGPMTLRHCTLASNTTSSAGANTGDGGAIFNNNSAMSLIHCTVAGNTAPTGASGTGGIMGYLGTVTLTNCIVAGNTISNGTVAGDVRYHSSTLVINGTNIIPASTNAGALTNNGTILTTAPLLAPLGSNGGPTQTMPPLPGSPATDAASTVSTSYMTDQRGAPLLGSGRDIGAVELGKTTVNTTADETDGIGSGGVSLREALTDTTPFGSELITFTSTLDGTTLSLGSTITVTKPFSSVDARSLSAGLTINDGSATSYGLFSLSSGSTLAFQSLTLANGGGIGFGGNGGAIDNNGGTLTLTQCTLSGNSVGSVGGAISNSGTLTLTQCTLSGNSASIGGGAIATGGPVTLTQCTLSGNSTSSSGGAIRIANNTLTLTSSIVAGNTASSGPDIYSFEAITCQGANIVQTGIVGGTVNGTGTIAQVDPLLAPLGSYGGPTKTMPPQPGSPAIDPTGGATSPPFPTDQRGPGFARLVGVRVDVGAVESGTAIPALMVNTTADENNGLATGGISLRDAITFAPTGSTIVFATGLGPITLGSEIILSKSLTIDASSLTNGITVDGGAGINRIFTVNSGQTVLLKNLTLTGGATSPASNGGAVLNNGTLTVEGSTLHGNAATLGGAAIFNAGTLTMSKTTRSNHPAGG